MKCDGNHADPPCNDPQCWRRPTHHQVTLGPGFVNLMRPADSIFFPIDDITLEDWLNRDLKSRFGKQA